MSYFLLLYLFHYLSDLTIKAKRHRAASAVTYALIFASCLAGAAGGGWVPATVLTAFALIVKSDK